MARTAQFGLPLVAPSQAQKHVTVNEALVRLDAVAQLRVISSSLAQPPSSAVEGASYLLPSGASGEWQGKAGQIAVQCNGGWIYLAPKRGWRTWDEGRSLSLAFDGTGWIADAVAISPHGAATAMRVVEIDHVIVPGATNQVVGAIPAGAMVLGVTGRVTVQVRGAGLTSWRIGVSGSDNRYGSGLGITLNSSLVGMSGTPVTYYAATSLLIVGEGGALTSGQIRFAVHLVEIVPPRVV